MQYLRFRTAIWKSRRLMGWVEGELRALSRTGKNVSHVFLKRSGKKSKREQFLEK
jgi:hypothetical protein